LVVEFIVLQGDISRMNTVFKFYFQAWVLFSLASAAALSLMWDRSARHIILRSVWFAVFIILFGATLLYPIFATRGRILDRFDRSIGPTLDGTAFMEKAVHEDRGRSIGLVWDKKAMEWLEDNVAGSPVIAETNTHPILYGWGNRMSMFTGLPGIVGWDWHQHQQRAVIAADIVERRIRDAQWIYNTPDAAEAYRILNRYQVRYVIVGALERAHFRREALAKFDDPRVAYWTQVYENPEVKIYRVNRTVQE
jgi:uncharacterized membrane protein